LMGGLPRLCKTVGLQRAMAISLTGQEIKAEEAKKWGLVWKVVEGGREELLREAVEMGRSVARGSPDSVVVSRADVRAAWGKGVKEATGEVLEEFGRRLMEGSNVREGLRAFGERRAPRWVPSKL